ncbi:MAG: DUF4363 family protein [Ruminococcaceae bacterium]|nr:DUF4363 family protein [Oscillospiraceae bacterium]
MRKNGSLRCEKGEISVTAKIFAAVLILAVIFSVMFFGMSRFVDTVENFISQTGDLISAPDISSGIEAFYEFENDFYENEAFISLFINDSVLEELRIQMVEIRTAFFNGERDEAVLFTSLLRERFLQIRRSVQPTAVNIF